MIKSSNRILKLLVIGILFFAAFFYANTAFSITDEFPEAPSDGKVSNGSLSLPAKDPLNPNHVAAIKKVAAYLDKMGRKDLAASLPTDFENGKIYVDKLGMGVNAEVQLIPPRRLAISDETIQQLDMDDGRALATWALTFVHEDVHMKQWLPLGNWRQETPAWAAAFKENGLWVRNTLDQINQVDQNTTLSSEERGERLQELNALLVEQYGDFESTLNDMRGMTAEGKLNKDNEWQGLPPTGSIEASGTTDLEAIGKYAEFQVKAGQQIAMPYVKISPRPGTAKTGDKIKLETKLFNMPALSQILYEWRVSFNGSEIAKFNGESFSYVVDKPGQWTMKISVHARGKNNRSIVVKAAKTFLEDSITIKVEDAVPAAPSTGGQSVKEKVDYNVSCCCCGATVGVNKDNLKCESRTRRIYYEKYDIERESTKQYCVFKCKACGSQFAICWEDEGCAGGCMCDK